MGYTRRGFACVLIIVASALGCQRKESAAAAGSARLLRFGHFPNVTHAHGLIAHRLTREGKGWFEQRLGEKTKIDWFVYNAGPGAMEALLAGSLDVTYVGPSPAINAHVRAKGKEIRVLAGATRGGAALVVKGNSVIRSAADCKGKKIATPQLGNTQDVSCRAWLAAGGLRVTQTGGDVTVVPTNNPDQLALFQRGELDGAWTVEPWVSRLELEANARALVEERESITTILASSARFLAAEPELAKKIAAAHAELTRWIVKNPEEARRLVREEIAAETTRPMAESLLLHCWPRLRFQDDVKREELEGFVASAKSAGFLKDAGDLSSFIGVLR